MQQELVSSKAEQLSTANDVTKTTVEESVKSEFKSYSSVLGQNKLSEFSSKDIKNVVRTVVEEEDRSKNLIVFGLAEEQNENLEIVVSEVLQQLDEKPKIEVTRLGQAVKTGDCRNVRPVKVTFINSLIVRKVLNKSKDLKGTDKFSRGFICPDRSPEQRVAQDKTEGGS